MFWLDLLSRKQPVVHFSCSFWKAWRCSKLFHWKSEFEMKISEKNNQILKQTFSCTMKIWNEKFPKCQVLNWEFFFPAVFQNKNFRIIIFQRKSNFENIRFWIQLLRNKDFNEKFICEKNRFDSVCFTESNPTSAFRTYFKKHDSEANFFIGNRCLKWSSFEKKESDYEAKFFLEIEILNWKFFNKSDF